VKFAERLQFPQSEGSIQVPRPLQKLDKRVSSRPKAGGVAGQLELLPQHFHHFAGCMILIGSLQLQDADLGQLRYPSGSCINEWVIRMNSSEDDTTPHIYYYHSYYSCRSEAGRATVNSQTNLQKDAPDRAKGRQLRGQ
jgi:hypothetical protein